MPQLISCIMGLILVIPVYKAEAVNGLQKSTCRCKPAESCWPDGKVWGKLADSLNGKLIKPQLLTMECQKDANSKKCLGELNAIKNPFYIQSKAGGTQTQGWYKAWDTAPSIYAVEAKTTQDIVAAVNFARKYNLRLIIKGGGHDYLGRSSAPDSLLVWTHDMRQVKYESMFIPIAAPKTESGIPAITVEAGTRWVEAYNVATTVHNQYVQGGGCASVGAAGGFTQGGGFGSFSKKFGTGAAGVVQVEVVTADGKVLIANKYQNSDLFWAIRGGGGGTYGIVSKMTLRLHDLPTSFGIYKGTITANDEGSFKKLIQKFLIFFANKLDNEHWGEQFSFNEHNQLNIFMVYQGLTPDQVNANWSSFIEWAKKDNSHAYTVQVQIMPIPPRHMWDYDYWKHNYPEMVAANTMPGAAKGEFWWAPNTGEASQYIYTYQSWWLPESLLQDNRSLNNLSMAFYNASRVDNVSIHINKGLAGASTDAILNGKETSTNPRVYAAAALVLMGAGNDKVFKGVNGHEVNDQEAARSLKKVSEAMNELIRLAPDSGTYVNEADYFEKNWQKNFWGDNYGKLYKIKLKYDPNGLFYCHHCVGSELWSDNGMCRAN